MRGGIHSKRRNRTTALALAVAQSLDTPREAGGGIVPDLSANETVLQYGRSPGIGLLHLRPDPRFQGLLRRMNSPP